MNIPPPKPKLGPAAVLWAIVDPLIVAVAFVLTLMPPPKAEPPATVFLMIREFVTVRSARVT
jgi:hypothetical protein